jgi:hypothetical protein
MAKNPQTRRELRAFLSKKQTAPGQRMGRALNVRYSAPMSLNTGKNLLHPESGPYSVFPFKLEYLHPTKGHRSMRVPLRPDQVSV